MSAVQSLPSQQLGSNVVRLAGQPPLVIAAARVIDGTGRSPIADAAVVVEDRRVTYVGSAAEAPNPPGAQRITHAGKSILPGLIDAHLHLTGDTTSDVYRRFLTPEQPYRVIKAGMHAATMLAAGFTTVRDIGLPGPGLALREAVRDGLIEGPRILTAVAALGQTGGHADWHVFPYAWVKDGPFPRGLMVDGPDACRRAVRLVLREGADLVKLFLESGGVTNTPEDLHAAPEFTDEELKAIIEEAHRRGVRVAAHAKSASVIRRAVEFGVDTIEHGDLAPTDRDVFELMAERNVVLVPTLSLYFWVSTEGERWGIFKGGRDAAARLLPARQAMVRAAVKDGVKIAVGTDTGHSMGLGRNAKELELLVDAGLSPMAALHAATRTAAEALGLADELGTIEPGKLADLIVVEGDPLNDITELLKPGNPLAVYSSASMRSDS